MDFSLSFKKVKYVIEIISGCKFTQKILYTKVFHEILIDKPAF